MYYFRVGRDVSVVCIVITRRLLSGSFLELPYRILNMNHKTELLRGLWVTCSCPGFQPFLVRAPSLTRSLPGFSFAGVQPSKDITAVCCHSNIGA